jgi:hypothetical protein
VGGDIAGEFGGEGIVSGFRGVQGGSGLVVDVGSRP